MVAGFLVVDFEPGWCGFVVRNCVDWWWLCVWFETWFASWCVFWVRWLSFKVVCFGLGVSCVWFLMCIYLLFFFVSALNLLAAMFYCFSLLLCYLI